MNLHTITIPSIGEPWEGQGGIYAGLERAEDGKMYHVIVGGMTDKEKTWKDAKKWAEAFSADGHTDFTLPTRREQSLCFSTIPEQFQRRWHWSCEQHAFDEDYAWAQYFGDGFQLHLLKSVKCLGCAVRRFPI